MIFLRSLWVFGLMLIVLYTIVDQCGDRMTDELIRLITFFFLVISSWIVIGLTGRKVTH